MKKLYFLLILLSQFITAQVGINTTDPKAQLEIKSSNQLTPSNTDGLLIPKIDAFPAINPTSVQQGMLVYLNTTIGTNQPGFYYWDNPTTTWLPIKGNNGVTLDQAYDFGGAGNGKTITADAGAVLINGTDGLVSTGTSGSGAIAPSGGGTRMVWNPRKAAFRAGDVSGTEWDDVNIGIQSSAFGFGNRASGNVSAGFGFNNSASGVVSTVFGQNNSASGAVSTAFGQLNSATGIASTALGALNTASGDTSTAFGISNTASGDTSTAFGISNTASGTNSTAFGTNNTSFCFGETTFGIGATFYTPSLNGTTQFRSANATDRLFVIGNAIDLNNNFTVDPAERRDALIVLKNGLTRLPSTTNTMIDGADGKAVVTKEYLQSTTSGTLDQAYDFGGAGAGKTITADAGAVLIDGTDGLVSTGVQSTGAVAPSGVGTRMVWNPRKAAFRAGRVTNTAWDDVNIGLNSVAFGVNTTASSTTATAFGSGSIASGSASVAFGNATNASGSISTSFGNTTTASGSSSTAFGSTTTASGSTSTAFGSVTNASGFASTSFGNTTTANGQNATAFGFNHSATSFGETTLGIGATTYTPSINGAFLFGAANANDRLLTIGNAIDVNNNVTVDTAERSDALVILKNGATGIGTSLPNALLDVNATDNGILIPRIALTSVLAQAPVINPRGGALPVSTMIYNTATAGVSPNNVFPGFYYWNGTRWIRFDANGENNPTYYTAVGTIDAFSPISFSTISQMNVTFTPKDDVALVHFSAAGHRLNNNCTNIAIFFQILLNGVPVTGWQTSSKQAIVDAGSFFDDDITTWDTNFSYPIAVTIGTPQTIQIQWSSPDCSMSNTPGTTFSAFGSVFKSYRSLTVIDPNGGGGIVGAPPVSTNVWAHNGNTGTNANFNFVGTADSQPLVIKSNNIEGLRVATNGNVGVGSTFPLEKLHIGGKAILNNGFSTDNAALLYRNNTDYMFLGPQSGSSANGGAIALFGSTNTSGGNAGGIDLNVPNGQIRMSHTNGSYIFRANSTSGYNATFELNDVGLQFGHDSASRAIVFNTASTERMRLTAAGAFGIGTPTPGGQFELSLNEGRKPTSNTWTIPSDARLKNVAGVYQKGLTEILQLKPIRYHYKNTDKRTFDPKVLDKEAYGFLAQEVQQVFPEAVGTDPDGYLNFDLHPILIASVNALKELDAKNTELKAENEKLKEKIKQHDEQIAAILAALEKRK